MEQFTTLICRFTAPVVSVVSLRHGNLYIRASLVWWDFKKISGVDGKLFFSFAGVDARTLSAAGYAGKLIIWVVTWRCESGSVQASVFFAQEFACSHAFYYRVTAFFPRWCTDLDFGAMLRYMITLCILKISMIQMMD